MTTEMQTREMRISKVTDEGIIHGYLSTYNDVDSYGTYAVKGCFDKSIEAFEKGEMIPILWMHDRTKPIGRWTALKSDEKGLFGEGKLTLEDPQAQIALAHLKDGSLQGLSIGFLLDYDTITYNEELDAYGMNEVELKEASIVTFPANKNAKVTHIKNEDSNMENLRSELDKINGNISAEAEKNKVRDEAIAAIQKELANLKNPITGQEKSADNGKEYERQFAAYLSTGETLNLRVAGSEGTNANGGYLCPDGLDKRVIELLDVSSVIRRNATIITPEGNKYERPYKKTGIASGWVGETDSRTATDAQTYDMISAELGELYAFPQYTQRFLADSWYNVESAFARDLALTFSDKEETAFISGNGTNKPKGILTYDMETDGDKTRTWNALQKVNSGSATGISLNSLYKIKDSLNAAYKANAKWYMNTNTYTVLQQTLVDNTQHGIFGRGDVSAAMPETLLGYPIEIDDYLPDVAANANPIIFGDMRAGYAVLDRPGIGVLRDTLTNKPYIGLYSIRRVGGLVQDYRALKILTVAA